jgi:hypothetical protein
VGIACALSCLADTRNATAALLWSVSPVGLQGPGDSALDSAGRMTYAHRTTVWPYDVNLAVQNSGSWSDVTAGSANSVGTWPMDLEYAPNGEPSIAHVYYTGSSTAQYTYRSGGGTWQTERVSPGEGQFTSLAFASNGNAAMVYLNSDAVDGTGWSVDYAERTGTDTWNVTTVAPARYFANGHQQSLGFIPGSGEPAFSYLYGFDTNESFELHTSELRYAFRSGSSWFVETVDNSSVFTGQFSDMAFDSNGQPAISYYDSTTGELRIAFRVGTNNWQTETVDSIGDVGRFSSLLFLPDGSPAIAYSDLTNGDLKYAQWDGFSDWDTQVVAAGLDGYYPSLTLGPDGLLSIMFTDSGDNVYLANVFLTSPAPEPSMFHLLSLGLLALRKRRC